MAYQTEDNIQQAFSGESRANRLYRLFAEKAEKDGYPQVARLFRAVAEAETVHARNHINAVDGIGSRRRIRRPSTHSEASLSGAHPLDPQGEASERFGRASILHATLHLRRFGPRTRGERRRAGSILVPLAGRMESDGERRALPRHNDEAPEEISPGASVNHWGHSSLC